MGEIRSKPTDERGEQGAHTRGGEGSRSLISLRRRCARRLGRQLGAINNTIAAPKYTALMAWGFSSVLRTTSESLHSLDYQDIDSALPHQQDRHTALTFRTSTRRYQRQQHSTNVTHVNFLKRQR